MVKIKKSDISNVVDSLIDSTQVEINRLKLISPKRLKKSLHSVISKYSGLANRNQKISQEVIGKASKYLKQIGFKQDGSLHYGRREYFYLRV